MADTRISDLTAVVTPELTDVYAVVQDGVTKKITAEDLKDFITGTLYAEVEISSAQILDLGTTPVEVLPATEPNKYYKGAFIVLEYKHQTTDYTLGTVTGIAFTDNNNFILTQIQPTMMREGADTVAQVIYYNSGTNAGNDSDNDFSGYQIVGETPTTQINITTINSTC